jgi:hypothetical protein
MASSPMLLPTNRKSLAPKNAWVREGPSLTRDAEEAQRARSFHNDLEPFARLLDRRTGFVRPLPPRTEIRAALKPILRRLATADKADLQLAVR